MMPKDPKVLASMMTDKIAGSKATFEKMGVPGLLKLKRINVIVHPSSVFECVSL